MASNLVNGQGLGTETHGRECCCTEQGFEQMLTNGSEKHLSPRGCFYRVIALTHDHESHDPMLRGREAAKHCR